METKKKQNKITLDKLMKVLDNSLTKGKENKLSIHLTKLRNG